ncbi:hypothetical protein [Planctomycetes bacterium Pan216]|uniref:hypothetical protein n=1 Tax=Kolteria novifilia TaxID=2527975 RepID=UPI0011A3BDAF
MPNHLRLEELENRWVPATLFVDDDFVSPSGNDYATIQSAIDNAAVGDVIEVAAGTYNENVVVDVNDLTILATDGPDVTTINGQSGNGAVRVVAGITDFAFGGATTGFTVNGGANQNAALYLGANGTSFEVTGNRLNAADGETAIETEGGQANHVFTDNIFDLVDGATSSRPLVYVNGRFVNNDSTNIDFIGNTFSATATPSPLLGLESGDGLIEGNTFIGTTQYASIEVFTGGNTIVDNVFEGPAAPGVREFLDQTSLGTGGGTAYDIPTVLANNTFSHSVIVDQGGGTFLPAIWANIQDAIDAASAGDTILVGAGTYDEDVDINKSLTLLSSAGAEETMINGQAGTYRGAVHILPNLADITVGGEDQGFTINGAAGAEAAFFVNPNVDNLRIEDNIINAPQDGLGLEFGGGQTNHTIIANTFGIVEGGTNNKSIVYLNGTISVNNASTNVDFIGNVFGGVSTVSHLMGYEGEGGLIQGNTFSGASTTGSLGIGGLNNTIVENIFNGPPALNKIEFEDAFDLGYNIPEIQATNEFAQSVLVIRNGEYLPSIWATVQGAINASQAGDSIYIGPGTYEGFVVDKDVTVYGSGADAVIAGPVVLEAQGSTIIDAKIAFELTGEEPGVELRGDQTGMARTVLEFTYDGDATGSDVLVTGSNAFLLGLTVSRLSDANTRTEPQVLIDGASGTQLLNNSFTGQIEAILDPNATLSVSGNSITTPAPNKITVAGPGTSAVPEGVSVNLSQNNFAGGELIRFLAVSDAGIWNYFTSATAAQDFPGTVSIEDLFPGTPYIITGSFPVEIAGTDPGEFTQITVVDQPIEIVDATLNVLLDPLYAATVGDSFLIINNEGFNPIVGTFEGVAEGDRFAVDGDTFEATYVGGDGNDFVLTVVEVTPRDVGGQGIGVARGAGFTYNTSPLSAFDASQFSEVTFGLVDDFKVIGDWDGNGTPNVGIARPVDGVLLWALNTSELNAFDPNAYVSGTFGVAGDTPIIGDWNGDGATEVGIYRSAFASWTFDLNGNLGFDQDDLNLTYGIAGDLPVVTAVGAEQFAQIGVVRDATWFLNNSPSVSEFDVANTLPPFVFGLGGDTPVIGDWNGDGVSDVGIFRDGVFSLNVNGDGESFTNFSFGLSGDIPIVGLWTNPLTPVTTSEPQTEGLIDSIMSDDEEDDLLG